MAIAEKRNMLLRIRLKRECKLRVYSDFTFNFEQNEQGGDAGFNTVEKDQQNQTSDALTCSVLPKETTSLLAYSTILFLRNPN
jgi:hypothetical protein